MNSHRKDRKGSVMEARAELRATMSRSMAGRCGRGGEVRERSEHICAEKVRQPARPDRITGLGTYQAALCNHTFLSLTRPTVSAKWALLLHIHESTDLVDGLHNRKQYWGQTMASLAYQGRRSNLFRMPPKPAGGLEGKS